MSIPILELIVLLCIHRIKILLILRVLELNTFQIKIKEFTGNKNVKQILLKQKYMIQ